MVNLHVYIYHSISTKDTLNASPPLMLKTEERFLVHELMPLMSKQYPVETTLDGIVINKNFHFYFGVKDNSDLKSILE